MTEQVLLLAFTAVVFILVPIFWAVRHLARRHTSLLVVLLSSGALALFSLYAYFNGQYSYIGSYYIRYGVLILGLASGLIAVSRNSRLPIFSGKVLEAVRLIVAGALFAGLLYVDGDIVRGLFPEKGPIAMNFPMKAPGAYLITEGSSSRFSNRHYNNPPIEQRYAIDIAKLENGRIQAGLIGRTLEDYHIYGEEIGSPCEGVVLEAVDGHEENNPGEYKASSAFGNHVILDCSGVNVLLAHFKKGSVLVETGQSVGVGAPLAQVGNSGFSTEPHLHLQASLPPAAGEKHGAPLPMTFNGRYLTNNSLVRQNSR